jgi:hypothetical protein
MSGPCCGDGCKWFSRNLLGDQAKGECLDPTKRIYYKYGGPVDDPPSVNENMTCSNYAPNANFEDVEKA